MSWYDEHDRDVDFGIIRQADLSCRSQAAKPCATLLQDSVAPLGAALGSRAYAIEIGSARVGHCAGQSVRSRL